MKNILKISDIDLTIDQLDKNTELLMIFINTEAHPYHTPTIDTVTRWIADILS